MNQEKSSKKRTSTKKKSKGQSEDLFEDPSVEPLPCIQLPESLFGGFGEIDPEKLSPLDQAQDLMYDAWEAPTRRKAISLAKKALKTSPDCADAYTFLAENAAETLDEAIGLYQKAVEAGKRALGDDVFEECVGDFWMVLETRPYMRACAGLAYRLWNVGKLDEAIGHYWEMLRLNPDDNQGIRYVLISCLLKLDRDEDAERLFKEYKDDCAAFWNYSKALLDFRKRGASPTADKSLKEAIKWNKHIPQYLLGRKKVPRRSPDFYSMGDDAEAIIYVLDNKDAWATTPGALEWLAGKVK
ncbi:MAG TPA: tetratricopeptide repeat protein [bacterium]|nr:tetratricopeptide repeat protein [bacterium]HQO34900.1 tetratricopeptide repeat protein [bacterium]HQQ00162.1 tetratricopeptide repeat protein [bacterium]